nr:pyruvate dehydrogenase (acetyl-transferring) E1 component subunit alpha [Actinomycetales bacterium]
MPVIPTLQMLTEDGTRVPASTEHFPETAAEFEAHAAELTPHKLRDAYRHMVRTRAFDTEATNLQRQGELGLWVPSRGQEAGQVGSALATPSADFVFPSYREHAVAEVRGLDLPRILPVMRGTRHGGWNATEYNFHLYTFVIGAHTLHAVGYAMGLQQDRRRGLSTDGSGNAVVCYLGDGATSQGDSNEALVFAASAQAPVLFIVQNNQWAISVPVETQSRVPIAQRADGFGIPRLRVDGNDVLASYAATRFALTHMREHGGPFYLEFVTYRMGAHTTSDDPTRYRTREEEAAWAAKDPIARLRALLESEGAAGEDFFREVDDDAARLATRTRESTRVNRAGDTAEMFDHVYATAHRHVAHERREWESYNSRAVAATGGAR